MTSEAQQPRKVIGLKYEPGGGLPEVILKGYGPVADEIIRRRGLSGKPLLVQHRELAEKLYRLPIDARIGTELFQLVAIILAHVFAVNGEARKENRG
jgi:type III secretion system FlhB-like substrate exporter